MAYFGHAFTKVFVGTGSIKTSGHTSDLAPGELGVFDYNTLNAIGVAGTTKNPKSLFVIGQGSFHKTDALSEFYGGLKESVRSRGILPSSIEQFYKIEPQRPKNEVWYVGYNGITGCNCLTAEQGNHFDLRIDVKGDAARRAFNRDLYKQFRYNSECIDACNPEVCPVPDGDPLKIGVYYANEINNNIEISKYIKASVVVDNPEALTEGCDLLRLSIADEGTIVDLGRVQAAYDDKTITRVARNGGISTYEASTSVGGSLTDYSAPALTVGESCSCPVGYSLVLGSDNYLVTLPLDGTEDLSDAAAQDTYAGTIATKYFPAITFDGAADVATNQITEVAHGFVTGTKVTYSDGGGTQVVGLVDGTDYFVIKVDDDTISLATTAENATSGTVIVITDGVGAAHTLTPVVESSFVSKTDGTATVRLELAKGTAIVAQDSDSVFEAGSTGNTCTIAGGTASWSFSSKRYVGSRKLCITLGNCEENSPSRLADVQAFLANRSDISNIQLYLAGDDPESIDNGQCGEVIELTQTSICEVDPGCKGYLLPEFEKVPGFEGATWEACPCVTETPFTGCVGIKLETAYQETKFGDCSFSPNDHYDVEPIKINVSLLDDGTLCTDQRTTWAVTQTQFAKQGEGFGESAMRDYIQFMNYKMEPFCENPRWREVTDQNHLEVIDRSKFYKHYFLIHTIPNYKKGMNVVNYDEKYVLHFMFDEGTDTSEFETIIGSYAGLNGVFLETK